MIDAIRQAVNQILNYKQLCNIQIGIIVQHEPLKVKISDGFIINKEFIILSKALSGGFTKSDIGKGLIIVKAEGGQMFFAIDRLGGI